MGDLAAEDVRCPQCRAAVPERASWCSQCYASLPPAEQAPAPPAPRTTGQVAVQLLPDDRRRPSAGDAGWPCGPCGASNALADSVCASCGAAFLSALRAAEPPLLELPGVGDVTALSRRQRLGLGVAVVAAVLVLVLLLGLLTA